MRDHAKYSRIFRERNPGYRRAWYAANRPRALLYAHNSMARNGGGADVPMDQWLAKWESANGRCHYCGSDQGVGIDHVVPLSAGGKHEIDNIVPACKPCNLRKAMIHPDHLDGTVALTKVCPDCRQTLPRTDFGRRHTRNSPNAVQSYCLVCARIRARKKRPLSADGSSD